MPNCRCIKTVEPLVGETTSNRWLKVELANSVSGSWVCPDTLDTWYAETVNHGVCGWGKLRLTSIPLKRTCYLLPAAVDAMRLVEKFDSWGIASSLQDAAASGEEWMERDHFGKMT